MNLKNGDNKADWNHVLQRSFSDKNASQFTISQSELRLILEDNYVSKVPISRIFDSKEGIRFERVVRLDKNIGTDKITGYKPTKTMTVLIDIKGNLITAHPGVLP